MPILQLSPQERMIGKTARTFGAIRLKASQIAPQLDRSRAGRSCPDNLAPKPRPSVAIFRIPQRNH
jgi:hypothetical protein